MVQWLITNDLEWIWKDAVVAEVLLWRTLDTLRKTTRNLSQNSQCRRQELTGASPEQKRTAVPLQNSVVSTLALYVGGTWFRPRQWDRLFWQVFLLPSIPHHTHTHFPTMSRAIGQSVSVCVLPYSSLTLITVQFRAAESVATSGVSENNAFIFKAVIMWSTAKLRG
jgi:hypothetical protein